MEQPEWGIKLSKYCCIPQRVVLALMGFLAIVNAYTMRICLSVTITQLVVPHNRTTDDISQVAVCPKEEVAHNATVSHSDGKYEWSEELQGFILSAFYIGYIVSHIPGGILAERFGAKWVLSLGILSTAIFTIFFPLAINYGGSTAMIIMRVLMGLGEGTTFPALSAILSQWVPRSERGMLGSLVLGGGQIGSILGNTISGFILASQPWPNVFYVFAAGAIVWFIFFTLLCYSDPASHPFIKPSEKEYLMTEMGHIKRNTALAPTPWKAIFTSVPMWSLISAQIGHDWAFYVVVTDLPKYMNDVLQVSVKSNGIYSSLPFVSMWIMSVSSGLVADLLIRKDVMNTTNVRKLMTGLAAFGPAIFMIAASYAGCDRILVVALFTVCMGLMGCYYAGMKLTPLDMSPNYSGTLMAIANGIGSITGVVAPSSVGLMTPNATMGEWRLVFWVAFFVLSLTAVMYCLWASGEVQPFDDQSRKDKD